MPKFKINDRVENITTGYVGNIITRMKNDDGMRYGVRWDHELKSWITVHPEHQLLSSTSTPPDRRSIIVEMISEWEQSELVSFIDELITNNPELIDLPDFQRQKR